MYLRRRRAKTKPLPPCNRELNRKEWIKKRRMKVSGSKLFYIALWLLLVTVTGGIMLLVNGV